MRRALRAPAHSRRRWSAAVRVGVRVAKEGRSAKFLRSLSWLRGMAGLTPARASGGLPGPPIGQPRLGLASGIGEKHYRLTHATFSIEGAAEVTLDSDDDPASDVVQRALPEGGYSVQLLDGWQLERA